MYLAANLDFVKLPVTLQINTAPVDYPYLTKILPHQLKFFGHHCQEILITIETRQSKKTRWKSDEWNSNLQNIHQLCNELSNEFPHLRANPIDYSDSVRTVISRFFLTKPEQKIPFKDFRGGPYYSYYYGLHSASQPYVFHMDSDMIFHGDGEQWLKHAVDLLETDRNVLFASPLLGPPVKEDQEMPKIHKKRYNPHARYPHSSTAYKYLDLSTRIFFVEKERLRNFCPMTFPYLDQIIKSWLRNTPPYHTPERSITTNMKKNGFYRVDFMGPGKGLYCIHTQVARDPNFIPMLDHVLQKVETGFFTEDMRGFSDFTQTFIQALRESANKKSL